MRWNVKIECVDGEGQFATAEVLSIERPSLESAAELGLTLEDSKRMMALLQERIVEDQLRDHCRLTRICAGCARPRAIKDHRLRVIDTVFGRVRADAPRYRRCQCGYIGQPTSPVSAPLPRRVLPELHHLQVSLGAEMPYRQAAAVLRTFLPNITSFNHATTRNRLSAVGQAIDDELRAEIADAKPTAAPAETMVVGIDGCYIKGIHKARKSSIEVVLGRVESRGRPSEVFAVVRKLDDLAKERVRSVMRRCGRGPDTEVVVLSAGEDGMRTMLGQWLDPTVKHRLDWWHLYRRIEKMRLGLIYLPIISDADRRQRYRSASRAIDHIRWTLWNGCECVYATDAAITEFRLELGAHAHAAFAVGRDVSRIDDMNKLLDEFRKYLYGNATSLLNYNHAHTDGERERLQLTNADMGSDVFGRGCTKVSCATYVHRCHREYRSRKRRQVSKS